MKMFDSTDANAATGPSGMSSTPATRIRRVSAPIWAKQGTAAPCAGSAHAVAPAALVAAHAGARFTDLPGSPPRGAPV